MVLGKSERMSTASSSGSETELQEFYNWPANQTLHALDSSIWQSVSTWSVRAAIGRLTGTKLVAAIPCGFNGR